ncbi:MAG: hypothetical protein AAB791_00015 [Patescibacteria group bacterium]
MRAKTAKKKEEKTTRAKSCLFYAFKEEGKEMAREIERKAEILANGRAWEVTSMVRTVFDPIHNKVGVLVAVKIGE